MAENKKDREGSLRDRAKKYAKGKYVPNPYHENETVRGMIQKAENVITDHSFKN